MLFNSLCQGQDIETTQLKASAFLQKLELCDYTVLSWLSLEMIFLQ